MQGQALFSEEVPPLYRHSLERRWPAGIADRNDRYLLWLGHNPSDAGATMNDPTAEKICKFTHFYGYRYFRLMNMSDRIATEPSELLKLKAHELQSRDNLVNIMRAARKADKIIVCWGAVHPSMQVMADCLEAALRAEGHELWTLVLNLDGSPKHPLYIKDGTPLMLYGPKR